MYIVVHICTNSYLFVCNYLRSYTNFDCLLISLICFIFFYSMPAVHHTKPFITSIVLGDDLVPRYMIHTIN